jgi:translation initiation factor 1 (eIF-1/SUI1)
MSFTPRAQPPGAGFDARMRLEKKGRGGQPVAIIFAVRSEALQRLGCKDLADLGRLLKQRLSCGGTVDESEVILQMRDRNRLESVLAAVGIKAQASGGF